MSGQVSAEELVERARKLIPVLKERAEDAGKLRRVPEETIADLKAAGLFRAVQPVQYGGHGLAPDVIYDIQLELGKGCASTSWVFGVLSVHTWQLALFPKQTQDEVWGETPDALISSSYMPVGKTEPAEGGLTLSGHWSFSSGCDHCDWVFLGGMVPSEGPPDMRTFLLPRSDYEIIDNWYVSGLKASGSKDIKVEGAFVPDHHMHLFTDGFRGESPGNEVNPGPEYRFPFGQVHVRSVSTPALGAALGALEDYTDFMTKKVSQATGGKAVNSFTNNVSAAEAAAVIDREILVLKRNFAEMKAHLEKGEKIPTDRRVRFRYDSARAVEVATQVVDSLMINCGGRALFEGNSVNRHFQDCHAIRAHHANSPDNPAQNFGGVQFGKKNTDGFI